MKSHYSETRESMTPEKAIAFLKEGNQRFLQNLSFNRDLLQLVNQTKEQQFPFAAILSCSDSRISPELVFDQGLGDIFSIRLAGNIASENAIGSMEFACAELGAKVIVVMGHTNCGAVKGACDNIRFGNLTNLIGHIRIAVDMETETPQQERNSSNRVFVNRVSQINVHANILDVLAKSTIIKEMVDNGSVGIVGAMYSVEDGSVVFHEEYYGPQASKLVVAPDASFSKSIGSVA
jgi:carbonic anhydrase